MEFFSNKNKKSKYSEIKICDISGYCIYMGNFISLPYDSNLIIEKSILYFDDPEPCFIHRTAVINRLCLELEEYLRNYTLNRDIELSINELPSEIKAIIPCRDIADKIIIQWVKG